MTYIETERYTKILPLLKKSVMCTANYQVHGMDQGTNSKTTCIKNIVFANGTVIDHAWLVTDKLANKHLKQGQKVKLILKPIKRIRPGSSFDERILDIKFELIDIL